MTIFQTLCRAVSVGESLQRTGLRHTRWDNQTSLLQNPPSDGISPLTLRGFHRLDDDCGGAGDLCKDLKQGREAF